jgi:hypothetical protein
MPGRQLLYRVLTASRLAGLSRDCRPFWSFAPLARAVDSAPHAAWLMDSLRVAGVVTNPCTGGSASRGNLPELFGLGFRCSLGFVILCKDELHPGQGPFQSIQSKSSSYRPVTRPAGASHGVRPLFDGLRSGEVSPYRFGDPSTPFYAALRYSYPRTRRAICIVRLAVLELTLSYRVCQTRPPSTHRQQLS